MNVMQSWIVVGVPSLLLLGAAFVGRSAVRALVGYVILAATVLFFVIVPSDPVSAAVFGLMGVLLVANGRGTGEDAKHHEHHEHRKRYTTDPSHA